MPLFETNKKLEFTAAFRESSFRQKLVSRSENSTRTESFLVKYVF